MRSDNLNFMMHHAVRIDRHEDCDSDMDTFLLAMILSGSFNIQTAFLPTLVLPENVVCTR